MFLSTKYQNKIIDGRREEGKGEGEKQGEDGRERKKKCQSRNTRAQRCG